MSIKHALKCWVERTAGVRVFHHLPHGLDVFNDIANQLPQLKLAMAFDVGANIGQSAREYLAHWPAVRLHCFEPASATFRELQRQVARHPAVACHQLAFGSQSGQGQLRLQGSADTFVVEPDPPTATLADSLPAETVLIDTLENFCQREGITRINFLKVDTEGHDLQVLIGAGALLRQQRVDLIQVEAGLSPRNQLHVPLPKFQAHLEPLGYLLFGLYEQTCEWRTGEPILRRVNAVFVRDQVAQLNTSPAAAAPG